MCARACVSRRAYDALNVLTAMDIISKDKKDIQWKGFPPMVGDGGERAAGASSAGRDKEKARLKSKIDQKSKDLKQKEEQLKELVNQFVSLKQLLSRNAKPEYSENADQLHRIYLPFVIGLRLCFCAPRSAGLCVHAVRGGYGDGGWHRRGSALQAAIRHW